MGRYITCEIETQCLTVWKYAFGQQPSEMGRIYKRLGIGKYYYWRFASIRSKTGSISIEYSSNRSLADGDVLVLCRKDFESLNRYLGEIQRWGHPSENYVLMIEAIRDFMLMHPSEEKLVFKGEF